MMIMDRTVLSTIRRLIAFFLIISGLVISSCGNKDQVITPEKITEYGSIKKNTQKNSKSSHPYNFKSPATDKTKSSRRFGLTTSKKEKSMSKINNKYGLMSSSPEKRRESKVKNPYAIKSKNEELSLSKRHPYGLVTSEIKIAKSKKQKKKHPYDLKNKGLEAGLSSIKHPYVLSKSQKEVKLSKNTNSRYLFRSKTFDKRLDKQNKPYFEYDYTAFEEKELTAYIAVAPGIVFTQEDLLKLFKSYKKPKIRAFLLANQNYSVNKHDLEYSKNDIKLFSRFLTEVLEVKGNRIKTYSNLTESDFLSKFKAFTKSVKADELVLFFYSGHCKDDGIPVFTDMKSLSPEQYNSLLQSFTNDTAIIIDGSYIENQGDGSKVVNVVESPGMRDNIVRIYSNLTGKQNKEGAYKDLQMYKKKLKKTYSLLDQINAEQEGNGIFTLMLISFFADFSFTEAEAEVSFETLHSYIHSKVSSFEESGVMLRRPKKIPMVSSKFKIEQNNYLLFKKVEKLGERLSKQDRMLQAMFNKAKRLQNEGKYGSAVNLFLSVIKKRKGGDFRNSKARLAECYLNIADQDKDKDPEKAIKTYKRALKYNPENTSAQFLLGKTYEKKGDIKKAQENFNKVAKSGNVDLVKKSKKQLKRIVVKVKKEQSAKLLLIKGNKAFRKKEYSKSIGLFEKASKLYKINKDFVGEAVCLNNIGTSYIHKGELTRALRYHKKSLKIKKKIGDGLGIAHTFNNIGVIYHYKGDYEQAQKYFNLAVESYNYLNIRTKAVAICYLNLSKCYVKLNNMSKAISAQEDGIKLLEDLNDSRSEKEIKVLEELEKK